MATVYNTLRNIILARWDGQQPVSEVSLGVRTYGAWWMIGADMQQAQAESCASETGRALINLVCGCSVKRDIPREDRLAVLDASQVPALFLARAVEYLGTDDVVVLHDVSAAAFHKVVACAVPGQWWRVVNAEPVESSNHRALDAPDTTPEPPTPSAPAPTAAPSTVDDGQLSLSFDDDEEPEETETRSELSIVHSQLSIMERFARHCHPARYYSRRSWWSGEVETTVDLSTMTKVWIIGVCVVCVSYLPLAKYYIDNYWSAASTLSDVLTPMLVILALWTLAVVMLNRRVQTVRSESSPNRIID